MMRINYRPDVQVNFRCPAYSAPISVPGTMYLTFAKTPRNDLSPRDTR